MDKIDKIKNTKSRHLFVCGDCVSVPADYFGGGFEELVKSAGFDRIYGRVDKVGSSTGNLSVKWDCDGTINNHLSKFKVTIEPRDTAIQTLPSTNQQKETSPAEGEVENEVDLQISDVIEEEKKSKFRMRIKGRKVSERMASKTYCLREPDSEEEIEECQEIKKQKKGKPRKKKNHEEKKN